MNNPTEDKVILAGHIYRMFGNDLAKATAAWNRLFRIRLTKHNFANIVPPYLLPQSYWDSLLATKTKNPKGAVGGQ
jgi:hypothetical protein